MKKYIATFTALAEVTFTIEVEAENQQEGLIAAHDAALAMTIADSSESVVVSKLLDDSIVNRSLEGKAVVVETSLAQGAIGVQLFAGNQRVNPSLPVIVMESREDAEAFLMKCVLDSKGRALSSFGSGALLVNGFPEKTMTAVRGGWEVINSDTGAVLATWLDSSKDALRFAAKVLGADEDVKVKVLDSLKRDVEPVVWRDFT